MLQTYNVNHRDYLRMINEEQQKIPHLEILNKIITTGTINSLTKKELKQYIFYERLDYEKNVILLANLKHDYYINSLNSFFKDFKDFFYKYFNDVINNPLGYLYIEDIHNMLIDYQNDKRFNDATFYEQVLATIDPENFNKKDEIDKHRKFYNYLLFRKRLDFCKKYCQDTCFKDELIRYQIFDVPKVEIYADILFESKKFKINDYIPLLNDEFINTLKKYPM
ncbi:MAG: hypothetical protein J5892_04805 [Bacilli bacterium]|nr:hypothetical protein [Bacilli bacterium]